MTTTVPVDLMSLVAEDIDNPYTKDLPSLRYRAKNAFVFIFDENQDIKDLTNVLDGVKIGKELGFHGRGITRDSFLPMYNCGEGLDQSIFCLEESLDLTYLQDFVDNEGDEDWKPRPLLGTIFQVSIDGLIALDYYFENDYNYNRVLIDVYGPNVTSKQLISCYAYMNDLDHIGEYNPTTGPDCFYRLRKGMEVIPFSTKFKGDKEVFSY